MEGFYPQAKQETRVLRVQLPICDKTVMNEVSGEVSLPDYQPEIKRLLRVSATVQPPSHYVGGGAMEFTGTVDYCIFYTGNDGQMYCFPTSQDYVVRVPLEAGADFDLSDALVCYAVCEPESISSRVSGPRRMSVKCRLRSRVKAYGSCVMEERRQGNAPEGEERLMREATTSVIMHAVGAPFVLSDEVILEREGEGDAADDYRIISGDAQVLISEAAPSAGKVNCRGELLLKLLLAKEEDALPRTIWRKLPIDHIMPLDGVTENSAARVTGYCTELDLSMEDGRILCEVEIVLEAFAYRDETLAYTSDLYAIGCESATEMKAYRLPRMLRCINGNMTQSEALSLQELGLDGACRVADVHGTVQLDEVQWERGRVVASGKCRYTLILMNDGEMLAKELELPWRYTADGVPEERDALVWEGQVRLLSARARMDGERLGVDAELGISLCLCCEEEVSMVGMCSLGETVSRPVGHMLLCYPTTQDTLWSVGKRYHVALNALVESNHLPSAPRADEPTSLGEARVLVV